MEKDLLEANKLLLAKYNIDTNTDNILGVGVLSTVVKGIHVETDTKVIIKIFNKITLYKKYGKNRVYSKIRGEIDVLEYIQQNMDNPVIQLIDNIITDNYILIIYNYIDGIDLYDHILSFSEPKRKVVSISEAEIKYIFKKLLLEVQKLHKINIAHLDLKLENIVYNEEDKSINLIDFGYSKITVKDGKEQKLTDVCGTAEYVAPEILARSGYYGKPADIWSCGIILYIMCFARFPFIGKNDNETFKYIIHKKCHIPSHTNKYIKDILHKMLNKTPHKRPSVSEILESDYLKN